MTRTITARAQIYIGSRKLGMPFYCIVENLEVLGYPRVPGLHYSAVQLE